jgi:hypothetical protein
MVGAAAEGFWLMRVGGFYAKVELKKGFVDYSFPALSLLFVGLFVTECLSDFS